MKEAQNEGISGKESFVKIIQISSIVLENFRQAIKALTRPSQNGDQINIAARYEHIDTRPQIRPDWTEFAHELISPHLQGVKHGGQRPQLAFTSGYVDKILSYSTITLLLTTTPRLYQASRITATENNEPNPFHVVTCHLTRVKSDPVARVRESISVPLNPGARATDPGTTHIFLNYPASLASLDLIPTFVEVSVVDILLVNAVRIEIARQKEEEEI
ncbi:hypothetical protein CBL_04294 [Carabus blaptoides fortunei]